MTQKKLSQSRSRLMRDFLQKIGRSTKWASKKTAKTANGADELKPWFLTVHMKKQVILSDNHIKSTLANPYGQLSTFTQNVKSINNRSDGMSKDYLTVIFVVNEAAHEKRTKTRCA